MLSEDFMLVDQAVRELTQIHFNTKARGHRISEKVLEFQVTLAKNHLLIVSDFGRYP